MKIKKKYDLKITTVILFNHDSKFRNNKFLLPRVVHAIKFNKLLFLKKIYSINISGDFSHADDICNGIFLIINSKKNLDKIILSSSKITEFNNIINYFSKKEKFFITLKEKKKINKNACIGDNRITKKKNELETKKNNL